jgi:putative phage-type endonuclease
MLEELTDILNDIVPDEDTDTEDSILYTEDFVEMVLHLMEEYVTDDPMAITDPDFHNAFLDEICEMIMSQVGHELWRYPDDVITERLEEICEIFYASFMPRRSHSTTLILNNNLNIKKITKKIDYLRGKPQPAQRTAEWYEFRHKLITASNAYKGFADGSELNQLIFEKCQPVRAPDTTEKTMPTMVNVDTTLHWGQKFEPLSVMIYEDKYGTKIEDFGCIQHDKHSFLGASPDGINVDKTSLRYGRMLEIKNIVNREIDGVPKLEYWVQMQLQMETCDLDECDFVETRFLEYESESAFNEDDSDSVEYKGLIMYFTQDGRPIYKYAPLHLSGEELAVWEAEQHAQTEHVWIRNIYWKVDQFSCVLVQRNQLWFQDNISTLQQVWKTIEYERAHGFQHRAPARRMTTTATSKTNNQFENSGQNGCLISLDKETGQVSVNSASSPHPAPTILAIDLKIRTESFDDTKEKMSSIVGLNIPK